MSCSAPPYWINIWSLDVVRVVSRLANSPMDASSLIQSLRATELGRSLMLLIVVLPEIWTSWCLDSLQGGRFTLILAMHIGIKPVLLIDAGILHDFPVDLVLVLVLGVTRVPWWQTSTSSSTHKALLSIWIVWCCEPIWSVSTTSSSIIGLLPLVVAVLILISVYPSLSVLAHWDELLIGVPLT